MPITNPAIRTRFAPSPTGFMHVGNLRTALYEYLIAKSLGGTFVLRIEDTDQERYVEGAVDIIYKTLKTAGLVHDEGPDIGGEFGPYVQSERMDLYKPYAEELVKKGHAYYCFCSKERLASLHEEGGVEGGYDRHCRDLSEEEIKKNLDIYIEIKVFNLASDPFADLFDVDHLYSSPSFLSASSIDR